MVESLSPKMFEYAFKCQMDGAVPVSFGSSRSEAFHRIRTFNQCVVVIDTRVVDLDASHIVEFGVIGVKHIAGYIRDILPSITLAGNIYFAVLHLKGGHEIFPEAHEVVCHIMLVLDLLWGPRCGG